MDLLRALQGAVGSNELGQLASQFGLDSSSVNQVMDQVVPALGKGIQGNASSSGGLGDMLSSMLDSDGDGSAADDVLDIAKKLF